MGTFLAGLAAGAAYHYGARAGLALIWQSPRMFYHAGLYLKVGNKRYRIVKAGPR